MQRIKMLRVNEHRQRCERARHSDARVRAFTLIEVLAALVIVSLGLMAVIQAVSQSASNTAYLRDKTVAHLVAMNRLTELRLLPQAPPLGHTTGHVEMAGKTWYWSAQVSRTALDSMLRLDVGASADEQFAGSEGGNQLASITGFYGTKIAPPGTVTADFDVAPTSPGTLPGAPPGIQPGTPSATFNQ